MILLGLSSFCKIFYRSSLNVNVFAARFSLRRGLFFYETYALIVVMAKKKQTGSKNKSGATFDGVYLLKMVLYLLLGSMWIKISKGGEVALPIPIGLIIGLVFTLHEHFQIDRKIEYAIMLVAMLFGYFAPYGLYINF
jgi:hypothetical protein